MSAPTHTPGPWKAFKIENPGRSAAAYYIWGRKSGRAVAHIKNSTVLPLEANALLIAAAPDLLDALVQAEACMSIVQPRSNKAEYLRILGVARAALAKVKP